MDSSTFDHLARSLAGTASRRTTLAGVVAAISGILAPRQAEAQPRTTCREVGQVCLPERNVDCCPGTTCDDGRCRCPEGKRRCGDRCIPANRCCNQQCGGGAVCRNDRCTCGAGKKRCRGRCIPQGRCCRDGECGPNRECRNGRCRATGPGGCRAGTKPCNGSCIPTADCCGGCGAGLACRNGGCCNVTTTDELTTALADGGPDTIQLCPNTTYPGTFTISRNLTISGAGAASSVLDGNGAGRVLTITNGVQVTLRRLRVTGGRVAGLGGGISVAEGSAGLTLEDVEVSGNQATGGGIFVDGATLVLLGASRVAANTATGVGGGIDGGAAAITLRDTSEVTANRAESGGGIAAQDSTVRLLGQSRLHANRATRLGGGIQLANSSRLELREQSAITANTARQNPGDSGGGIFASVNSTVQILEQAQVTGNTPDNCQPDIGPPNGTCV